MLADDTTCYRHHDRKAAVSCQRCERPICAQCMNQASVGFHCPECARKGAQKVIPARAVLNQPARSITVALIWTNVAVFLGQMATDRQGSTFSLTNWGLLYGPAVAAGDWWRIVTSGFLHENPLHIAFNMYALWILGPPLERMLGPVRFVLAYTASLLGGALAVVLFNYGQPTLGASGAVLGLAGALAAALWARGVKPTQTSLGPVVLINLGLPLLMPQISFWGHFGGIVIGFAAGWLLTWLPTRYKQAPSTAVGSTAALCVALLVATVSVAALGGA